MTTLLHIEASPRAELSHSSAVAAELLAGLRGRRPDIEVDRLNPWRDALPDLDGAALSAKYARLAGRALEPAQAAAWTGIEDMVRRVASAEMIVISTPIWNFGIPYKLKQLIDLITQPGLTFTFRPEEGYRPLLPSRPTAVVLASAGNYASGLSRGRPDLATPYLREALAFIGLRDACFIPLGPTVGAKAETRSGRKSATAAAIALAARWASL